MIAYQVEFEAMGCRMSAALQCDSQQAAILEEVPGWFAEWEAVLSRFKMDSELCRVNARAGLPTPVSNVFWQVLLASRESYRCSGGLVTPLILEALEMAGYDRSFDLGLSFAPADRDIPPIIVPFERIDLDAARQSVCLPPGSRLDFGGVAKSWAAHEALKRLQGVGAALVDAGGDIAVSSALSDGQPWPISIRDPFNESGSLGTLLISHGGVATSGKDYRRWKRGDNCYHHIINPRTARPAQTDLLTVTVIAADAMQAESACKTVFILGQQDGLDWLVDRPEMAALLVTQNGAQIRTPNFKAHLWQAQMQEEK